MRERFEEMATLKTVHGIANIWEYRLQGLAIQAADAEATANSAIIMARDNLIEKGYYKLKRD